MPNNRRDFLFQAAGSAALLGFGHREALAAVGRVCPIKKALKYGMIGVPGSMTEKFQAAKEIGFVGIELDSPNNYKLEEVLAAKEASGLDIHGVVDSVHWKQTLSDPDPKVQERGRDGLIQALRDSKAYGGTTALLVPGVVNAKITFKECWDRSIANIRQVLPICEETGIKIAIENVWNNFLTNPKDFARYIDEIDSPWVGAYFDIGNTARYSPPEKWIPILGKKRIFKLDVKAFDTRRKPMWNGFKVKLGDGDIDWGAVRAELAKIDFAGYGTAEMPGGDRAHLTDLSQRMDRVLCGGLATATR